MLRLACSHHLILMVMVPVDVFRYAFKRSYFGLNFGGGVEYKKVFLAYNMTWD